MFGKNKNANKSGTKAGRTNTTKTERVECGSSSRDCSGCTNKKGASAGNHSGNKSTNK